MTKCQAPRFRQDPAHGYVRGMLSRTSEDHRTTLIASRCEDPWHA
jgi:hypothetical protein